MHKIKQGEWRWFSKDNHMNDVVVCYALVHQYTGDDVEGYELFDWCVYQGAYNYDVDAPVSRAKERTLEATFRFGQKLSAQEAVCIWPGLSNDIEKYRW